MNDYCCNISVLRNSNKRNRNPQTSLEDLNNEMLLEILYRLPCYRTALGCKAVSKRWYSLISDPLFITHAFLTHRGFNEKEPSSAFLLISSMTDKPEQMVLLISRMRDKTDQMVMVTPPCSQRPFSLQFLPYQSTLVATFKDMILSFGKNPLTGLGVFYICNPLTKQWMVLPPSQTHQEKHVDWAVLTYLEGRGFRVVVAYYDDSIALPYSKDTFVVVSLSVYISETCQWRDVDVRLQLQPSNDGYIDGVLSPFSGVVCKGMVCIHNREYIGVFNPFDVTNTFHGTLTAINLPLPAGDVDMLLESDGNLVAFENSFIQLRSNSSKGNLACNLSAGKRIWKLDMRLNDKQSPQWELISEVDGHIINVKVSILTPSDFFNDGHNFLDVVGVHPSKEHILYLINDDENTQHRLILYDTKSKTLEALTTTIPPFTIYPCNKLDIPCWPTPIPIPL